MWKLVKKRIVTVGLIISLLTNVLVISQNFIIKNKAERYKISLLNSVVGYINEINNSLWFMDLEYEDEPNSVIEGRMAGYDERIDALVVQVRLLYATHENKIMKKFLDSIILYQLYARELNYISDRDKLYNVFQDFRVLLNGIEDKEIKKSRDFDYMISQFEDLIEEFLRSVKTKELREYAEKEGYITE